MKPEQQNITSKQPPRARFVNHLPDLINPEDYCRENNRKWAEGLDEKEKI